jgi:hypothetical protein
MIEIIKYDAETQELMASEIVEQEETIEILPNTSRKKK